MRQKKIEGRELATESAEDSKEETGEENSQSPITDSQQEPGAEIENRESFPKVNRRKRREQRRGGET